MDHILVVGLTSVAVAKKAGLTVLAATGKLVVLVD